MTAAAPPPILAEIRRGGLVESAHRGSIVILAADGTRTTSIGLTDAPMFPRSTLKPFQAAGLVDAGFTGRGSALALAASSHAHEPDQVAGVREILATAGVSESALQCPADPTRIDHMCSGKHAAMLATAAVNGWDLASYCDPSHPVQQACLASVEHWSGETLSGLGVDGCGAPAVAITLAGLARAYAQLGTADSSLALVAEAMRATPVLVGGANSLASSAMTEVCGLVCKDGVEGVMAGALPDGRAFAMKVEDGSDRPIPGLLAGILNAFGITTPWLTRQVHPDTTVWHP